MSPTREELEERDRKGRDMRHIAATTERFLADDSGAAAVEYAIVAVLIGAAVAGTVTFVGQAVNGCFTLLLAKWP